LQQLSKEELSMDKTVVRLHVTESEVPEAKPAKQPVAVPTPAENLAYIHTMLRELREKASECDWQLAHFIEIAYLHNADLLNNPTKMRRHRK
jgi:hypothetical protein